LGTPVSGNLGSCSGYEGTAIASTGETGGTKFLREDGDDTSSWQTAQIATDIGGLGTGIATFLGTPSSTNLISAITDETGSGSLVFATSPTLVTPILGTPTSGNLSNCTDVGRSVTTGITADAGSAQGGSPLTSEINVVSTVATIGDSVTLPTAVAGLEVTIINQAANAADVFPASGGEINDAGVNTAVSLAGTTNATYKAINGTDWYIVATYDF
jgi:hypothetical protein